MNRIYKVIWSKTKHCYVVVSELAKRHTKGGSAGGCRMMTTRVLSTLLLGAYLVGGYSLPSAWADGDPNEAEVAAGDKIAGGSNVTVSKNLNTITISATDTTYTAGDGLQLLDGTTFSVKADGNTIAVGSNGIKVNADGTIASGDTGIVTGGAVYDVTQPLIEKIEGITREGTKTTIERGFTVQTNFNSGSSNGYMNVYWGQDTLANGENATAWGKSTVARSPRSTAWGNEATAKGDQATAFGSRTTAYGVNSTAWGADTVAFSHQATAFGENTTAGGQRATAWGHKTTAGGDSSTAYGKETSALMEGATAWGNNTKAGRWTYTGDNGVVHDALVIQPYTDVHNGSEMYEIVDAVTGEQIHNGENDYIDAYDWLAANGTVNGVYSTAWGNGTQAAGDYSTAFGNYTKTAAVTSLKYNGTEAKVVSKQVEVKDADGNTIMITDENHPEWGSISKTETKYAIVDAANPDNKLYESYFDTEDAAMKYLVQNGTITGGYGATAFGLLSEAKGAHSTAFGVQTIAEGTGATAWGNSTTASGKGATASGYGTKAEGDYSTAFGNNTTTAAVTSLKYRDPYNNDDWTEAKIITKNTDTGLKYVIVEAADPNKELYFSYFDTEDAAMNQIALDGKITGGYGATAFGLLSEAKGAHSTAFGVETVAEGTGATAWGRKAKATGDYSTAWGFNTEAINDKSTAFGDNTIAGGKIATAWGYKTAAGGRTSTAFGSETVALTEGATAWGNNTKAGKWTYAGHDVFIKKEGDGRYHIIDEYGNSGSNGLPGQTFVSYDEAYKELSTNGTVQGVYATAWGKDTKAEGDYSTAFGNYTKTAAVTSLKYNGTEAKVVSEVVVVKDANGNPVMITDPSHPESGEKIPATEIKYKIVNAVSPNTNLLIDDEGVETYFDSEDAAMKEIVDKGTIIGGYGATAFGLYSEAKGAHSTAFGVRTTAEGIGATAWGNGTQATGDYSTAFGNGSVANASNSLAALGGTTAEDAANSLAVGLGAQTTLPDSIALGSGAVADRAKYDGTDNKYTAYLGDETGETKTGSAWRSTANAIAIGHIDTTDDTKSVTRQIIGVAAGTEDTDAVNVAQLKAATFDMQGITRTETGRPGEAGYVATTTIENNLSVSSDGKVKWGKGTTAEGDYSTAGGFFTKANGQYATAFGRNTQANGYNSTAFGNAAKANGQYTTAFGSSTEASGDNSTAFGSSTKATGPSSTAFGRSTEANGYNSTAFGNYTQANGQDATAFGSSSIAAGDYSTAFGSGTQAGKLTYKKEDGSETEAKIVGYTTAAGDRKYKIVSLRNENDVLSDNNGVGFYYYDVLRDSNLTKQGDYSTAFGSNTVASGDNSTAFGSSTQALGDFSTAFGSNTVASGDNSTAFGSSTKATGSSSTAFGSITEANGPSGTAFGSGTMANGQHSTAFGSSSIASGYISTAFGSNTQAGKLTYKKADGREIEAKIVEYTTAAGVRNYKIVSLRNENDVLSDNNGAGFNMYDSAFLDENLTRQGDYSTAFGSSTIALGDYSTAWGFSAQANGGYSTAFGSGTEASGTGATAWGSGTKAGGDYSTAWGFSAQANGTYSTAFGNGSVANAYNSLAALGGTTGEKATNSVAIGTGATVGGAYNSENPQTAGANAFAFGNGAQATLSDSVALGSGAVANRAKYNASNNAYKAYLNEDDNNQKTDPAWRATHNAIAVGASATDSDTATVTRQITGVAAGTYDTDAVNVAQLKAATFNMQGITRTRSGNDNDGYTYTTTIEDKLSVSSNGAFSISGDNFTVASDGAISAAGGISAAKGAGGYNFTVDSSDGSIRTNGNISAVGDISADNITVAEGTYSYISAGTDVAGSLVSLDSQVKTNTDAIATKANTTDITVAADGNYISAGTDVAGSLVSLDNAVKANAGTIQGITRSGDATDGYTTTIEGKLSVSSNGAFSISGDKFTVNSDGAISAAGGKFSVGTNGGIVAADQKFRVDDSTGSMTVGSATQNTSVSDAGLTITDGPSVTKDGIDAGGKKITGVADGTDEYDAVNKKQLRDFVSTMQATGGKFAAGKGLTTVITEEENAPALVELQVNAGEGLGFADNGTLKVNAGDGLTIDTENGNVLKVNKGTIAENNTGFVTGGEVHGALALKANTDLDNISDNGKAAVRSLAKDSVKVVAGTYTTVGKGSDGNADAYTVSVTADGVVGSNNTGLVTGGAVYSALQAYQPDGEIAENNEKAVSGGTVFSALSAYAKADGATLSNATLTGTTISSGSIANDVKLGGADSNITVGDIGTLKSTVGDSTSGLVKEVSDNKASIEALTTMVGSTDSGLVQKVNNNASSITTLKSKTQNITATEGATTVAGTLSAGATTVTSLTDGKATLSGGALTGVTTITASGAISGGMATVTGLTVGETNVTTALTTTGAVAENNAGFVTGGAVYNALQAFKPDGKVEEGDTKAVSGDTVYKVTSGLDARITANANAIDAKADASTVTALSGKVSANETAIQTNATNIAANKTAIEKNAGDIATNKASIQTNATNIAANKTAIQTNATNIAANKTAIETNATNIAANKTAIQTNATNIAANKTAIETNATNIAANKTAIQTNATNIAANKTAIETNVTNIAANKTAIEKNAGDIATNKASIQTNATNIAANKTAIEKNASDITSLGTKVTANETALAQKADKANTLKGYGIEDAYTKEDSDTLLNKKADRTELDAVKVVVGDTNSGLVKDVNDLKNASQKITTDDKGNTKIDGTLVVEENITVQGNDVTVALSTDGEVAKQGDAGSEGYLKGEKVYDYLNKGENGEVKLAAESKQISMGQGSEAGGNESIAIGNAVGSQNNVASGTQSIAIGFGNKVTGDHSGAFGDPSTVTGTNSYSFGNNNTVGGNNTFVLGSNVNTNASNAVVLGDGSVGVDNAVSVGAPGNERQIKNVAPGTDATDVATMGQVYSVAQNINKVDSRLNKVGAGAAALAALHPIDTDDKFTMGLGYGNYRSAHAMAMGMFYRPTEKIMISVGGAFGNGENMVNAGISFALDKGKGFGTSKAVMAKNIKALSAENAAIKEENAGMKKQLDAQGQEIAALKAALARLEAKIGK